jgi:hypothetical protein
MNTYLPSKQFVARLIILIVIVGVVFGVYKLTVFIKNKLSSKEPTKLLVESMVQKDSNNNGIADWEESLWGLDPTTDGEYNKNVIIARRQALSSLQGGSASIEPTTENEKLSREFFAAIMSLEQSGNLTEEAMQAVSNAIGKKIEATPIPDVYSKNSLVIKENTEAEVATYRLALKDLLVKYEDKDIGNELTFISQGVQNNDTNAFKVAENVGLSYRSFGKELMKMAVPSMLADTHVELANNYEKTGLSIHDFAQVLSDPLVAMKGLVNYNKYSDALVASFEKLSNF